MSDDPDLDEAVREWLTIADRDPLAAELCLTPAVPLAQSAAYCCQQAAGKLMKALLVARFIPFPKTRDLGYLALLVTPA